MDKGSFYQLFQTELDAAARSAEEHLKLILPRSYLIELHGAGGEGKLCSVSEAINRLYLGPTSFFKYIDISIKGTKDAATIVFVRVSGHSPCRWSDTWRPHDTGPFRQLGSYDVKVL